MFASKFSIFSLSLVLAGLMACEKSDYIAPNSSRGIDAHLEKKWLLSRFLINQLDYSSNYPKFYLELNTSGEVKIDDNGDVNKGKWAYLSYPDRLVFSGFSASQYNDTLEVQKLTGEVWQVQFEQNDNTFNWTFNEVKAK